MGFPEGEMLFKGEMLLRPLKSHKALIPLMGFPEGEMLFKGKMLLRPLATITDHLARTEEPGLASESV
jgi:hypothetical protein